MRKVLTLFAVMLLLAASTGVFAHDYWESWVDRLWERGDPNTTYQHWDFSMVQDPAHTEPTEYHNPYGTPTLNIEGGDLETVIGPDGVPITTWHIVSPEGGGIFMSVPNRPEEDWEKRIYLQITSTKYTMNNADPETNPAATSISSPGPVIQHPHGTWYTYNWLIKIHPNPDHETIWVPFPESTRISQVVVDTQCVPEPGTLLALGSGLVGLAGVAIRRRR